MLQVAKLEQNGLLEECYGPTVNLMHGVSNVLQIKTKVRYVLKTIFGIFFVCFEYVFPQLHFVKFSI